MDTNVYIDAFNLYYGALNGTAYKWLDLDALCKRLLPSDTVKRIRYFTAPVGARPPDLKQPQRQQAYLRAIRTIPELSVHEGHFRSDPRWMPLAAPPHRTVEVIKTEEKGSDVNLATYMLLDGCKGDCQVAVVISNDSDLKEPIAVAQSELGMKVGVINPHPALKRSLDLVPTFFKQLRRSAVAACQFPPTLQDSTGAIRKPATW